MSEQLICLFWRCGGVAEGRNVIGKAFAWKIAVNRSILIEFGLDGTRLPNFDHLPQLLIANEGFIYLENGLLEYEENWVFEDLFGI